MLRLAPAVALLLLTGCPGELENPDQYPDEPLELCQLDLDVPALFQSKCGSSACHEGSDPKAGLDLVAPGVFERLENVPATQCEGRVRVDPDNPNASFLVEKLRGTQPVGCGERMPFVSFLTGAEIACVQRWVFEQTIGLDGGVSPDDGGVADAGDDSDAGETDGGEADMSDPGVDCTPFDAADNAELCTANVDSCEINALGTSCDTACATAGLTCATAFDNVDGMCAANSDAPATCDDDSRADVHCVCE
ncbi:MAG: hypothetical protein CMN30_25500 [Sandaracinus sp.]|nr:hypothetical protein [Sandaracinus sp.]|tara:strand:- start:216 stop:965 length:750 start_codon:yes stop_codon:yes gene_type:complete